MRRIPKQLNRQKLLIAVILVCLVILALSSFQSSSGKVVSVQDGDSLVISTQDNKRKRVRLYGIDAPEYHQSWGPEAQQFNNALSYQKKVSLQRMGKDQYDRELAIITLPNGKILNEELVREGHAWVYTNYCKASQCATWKELERQARKEHKGLWSQKNPLAPWKWRKKNKHQ